tara:strand:- start:2004 stop:2492 length:489 start_codon:yes stop_codon:yes gene_type:complete
VVQRVIPSAASQGESPISGKPSPNPVDPLTSYPWNPMEPVDICPTVILVKRVVPLHGANEEVSSIGPLVAFSEQDAIAVVAVASLILFAAGVCCGDMFDVCHVMFSGFSASLHVHPGTYRGTRIPLRDISLQLSSPTDRLSQNVTAPEIQAIWAPTLGAAET